jgi:surfactin synthase thioesterase subunit
MPRTLLEGRPVEEVASVLGELGGTPQEVLADRHLLRMLQPLLAADFEVNEAYTFQPQEPLPVPITAFAGTDDVWAAPDQVAGWAAHTSAAFELCTLSGGHFAVFEHSVRVHEVIAARLGCRS